MLSVEPNACFYVPAADWNPDVSHAGIKKKKYAKNTLYVLIHLFVNPRNGLDETYTHAHENNNNNKRIIEVFSTSVFNLTYNKGLQIAVLV